MDKPIRLLPDAPVSCLQEDGTPSSASEIPSFAEAPPAPIRDPLSEPLAAAALAVEPLAAATPAATCAPPTPPEPPTPPDSPTPPAPLTPLPLDVSDAVARTLMAFRPLAETIVLRVGVPARDAPDVVQKLLIALLPTWPERASWPTERAADYVAAAARIVARRYLWTAARRQEELKSTAALQALQERSTRDAPGGPMPEDRLLTGEAHAERARETRLDFLQASTAPAFWRVFHAYVVLGIPMADIARAEQAPVPTMYNRLRLARRDLRAAIARLRAATPH